jgi:4-hydroxythreonine-4-phosphate dehydrogenase
VPALPVGPIRLVVTLGDPRGIGPEVMERAGRAFLAETPPGAVELLLLGADAEAPVAEGAGATVLPFQGVGAFDGSELSAGTVSLAALDEGIRRCLAGEAEGIVTGPVSKPALHAAGARVPGQTELLQERAGADTVGMLMAAETTRTGGPLRILLLTTHLPLREVSDALTGERVESQLRLLAASLREGWEIERPRIALCALNPHASDGGLFGHEEATTLVPAVAALQRAGIEVEGPFPADTVFLRLLEGKADAVAVPAHDVGMAVFKTLAFGGGVNVTLGLPFVRTSPDHGTAFDRVGTGTANHRSALEALRLAFRIARNRALRRL